MARKFPIGIQTFAEIREKGAIYVDKTDLIYKLSNDGKVYFLSRPRRFGKSLLIDTLAEYFSGNKELFTGLAIDKLETEWKKHPLLRFDFSKKKYLRPEMLDESLDKMLSSYEEIYGRNPKDKTPSSRLDSLIVSAEKMSGQKVVFLVDEYDAPLLDTLVDKDSFEKMRQTLRDFYSPLKANDAHIKFIFITGITKFSQLSIFSELNNLNLISMDDEYASICGITEDEMKTQMKPEIEEFAESFGKTFDQACALLKRKYDGYHFSQRSPDIYNPFSLLNALSKKDLGSYWFGTGTPTFLAEQMKKFDIEPETIDEGFDATESVFDIPTETAVTPVAVLYQSGYLTIKGFRPRGRVYKLAIPNEEVREGLLKCLLPFYAAGNEQKNDTFLLRFTDAIYQGDIENAMVLLRAFFSGIPYDAEQQNENHYKTVFYLIFKLSLPFVKNTEVRSAAGRADAVVETDDAVYVFEFLFKPSEAPNLFGHFRGDKNALGQNGQVQFKLDGSADEALKQIDNKGYLIPYSATRAEDGTPKKLVKIGANFDNAKRTLGEWKIVAGC
jgi:hypothetical protein